MAPPRKLESLEALKKTFQEIGSRCKNTRFLGFKELTHQVRLLQMQLTDIHQRLRVFIAEAVALIAPPNPYSNRHTTTSSVQIIDYHLDMESYSSIALRCFLFLAVLLYEVNKISGSVLSVQTSDSRSKKYSGRALCRHGIVAFRDDTRL
ncbi:hypothetical protein AHAS_Ahas20G0184300 [Arachis hypogaea]